VTLAGAIFPDFAISLAKPIHKDCRCLLFSSEGGVVFRQMRASVWSNVVVDEGTTVEVVFSTKGLSCLLIYTYWSSAIKSQPGNTASTTNGESAADAIKASKMGS
jgi:hypothetical protein